MLRFATNDRYYWESVTLPIRIIPFQGNYADREEKEAAEASVYFG